jgi:hypothetical protein
MQPSSKLVKGGAVAAPPKPEPKPAPKPAAPQPQKAPSPDPLIYLRDKRVVIVQRGGTLIIGTLREFRCNWIRLEDAAIIGTRHRSFPTEVLVDRQTVSLAHEECRFERATEDEAA